VFEKGWRSCIEKDWQPGATMGKYLYNWRLKPDGTPDVQFNYFKVHVRDGYRWAYPVHECLKYVGKGAERAIYIDGMVLNHYPDPSKSRGSYLPLLELAVKEAPEDDRAACYLGREYIFKGMWEKCIAELKRYLALPSAVWNEERCAAMRWIAQSYYKLSDITEARSWYLRAIAEAPNMRDAYVEYAQTAYELGDWLTTFYMTEEALKILRKSPDYVNMGYAWDSTPDDLCAVACYQLGMYERSLTHAKAALAFSPNDARLQNNLKQIEEKRNE
jgi:tetratricopeptide (TPR) repeat protein